MFVIRTTSAPGFTAAAESVIPAGSVEIVVTLEAGSFHSFKGSTL